MRWLKYTSLFALIGLTVCVSQRCEAQVSGLPQFPGYAPKASSGITAGRVASAAALAAAGYIGDKVQDGAFSEMERRPRFDKFLAMKGYADCVLNKVGEEIVQEADLALADIELQLDTFGSKRDEYFARRRNLAEDLSVTTFPSKLQECHEAYQKRLQKHAQSNERGGPAPNLSKSFTFDDFMLERHPQKMSTQGTAEKFRDLNMSPAPWTEQYKERMREPNMSTQQKPSLNLQEQ